MGEHAHKHGVKDEMRTARDNDRGSNGGSRKWCWLIQGCGKRIKWIGRLVQDGSGWFDRCQGVGF